MYPNFYFFLKDALGIDQPWTFTRYIHSFGFFVAIAFVVAAILLTRELKRKEKQGLLHPKEETVLIGKPASWSELLTNLVFGFIVGYKILGVFSNEVQTDPQEYIFSTRGSWAGGILLGLLFSGLRFWEKNKQKLAKPEERKIRIWPHERVGDIVIIAAVGGFIGAKIFDNLENWDRFIQNPLANLLAPSGLTFYGGLICATIGILWYAQKKQISLKHLVDAAAPALMIAYAIGRIGCHVSGDGDWGVFNSAYTVDQTQKIVPAEEGSFKRTLLADQNFSRYLVSEYGSLDSIPHISFKGTSFLPNWFWAYNYPHNVNEVGSTLVGCKGEYCAHLNPPVFPTSLYETILCTGLFFVLWLFRKRINIPGRLFALYLVLNGLERFFIEKIRVNVTYNIFGFHPTQAELVAVALIVGGIIFWFLSGKSYPAKGLPSDNLL